MSTDKKIMLFDEYVWSVVCSFLGFREIVRISRTEKSLFAFRDVIIKCIRPLSIDGFYEYGGYVFHRSDPNFADELGTMTSNNIEEEGIYYFKPRMFIFGPQGNRMTLIKEVGRDHFVDVSLLGPSTRKIVTEQERVISLTTYPVTLDNVEWITLDHIGTFQELGFMKSVETKTSEYNINGIDYESHTHTFNGFDLREFCKNYDIADFYSPELGEYDISAFYNGEDYRQNLLDDDFSDTYMEVNDYKEPGILDSLKKIDDPEGIYLSFEDNRPVWLSVKSYDKDETYGSVEELIEFLNGTENAIRNEYGFRGLFRNHNEMDEDYINGFNQIV